MTPTKKDDKISITSRHLATLVSVFMLLGIFSTALFAFSNKADRAEIAKTRKEFSIKFQQIQTKISNHNLKIVSIELRNNAILDAVKEIKSNIKDVRLDIKELRKLWRRKQ